MKKKYIKYWKTITWAIIVFILSSLPGSDLDKIHFINIPYFDKFVHFGMYAILTFIFLLEQNNNSIYFKPKIIAVLIIGISSTSYGLLLEVFQKYLFSGRSAEFADFLADFLGSLIAVAIFYFFINWYSKRVI